MIISMCPRFFITSPGNDASEASKHISEWVATRLLKSFVLIVTLGRVEKWTAIESKRLPHISAIVMSLLKEMPLDISASVTNITAADDVLYRSDIGLVLIHCTGCTTSVAYPCLGRALFRFRCVYNISMTYKQSARRHSWAPGLSGAKKWAWDPLRLHAWLFAKRFNLFKTFNLGLTIARQVPYVCLVVPTSNSSPQASQFIIKWRKIVWYPKFPKL